MTRRSRVSQCVVEVDRIVLAGFDMSPEEAEGCRTRIEAKLRGLLERAEPAASIAGCSAHRLTATSMELRGSQAAGDVAAGIARAVARALRDGGSADG
ncbi:hypothetical protein KJ567_04850 [Candidatus Bipolaricaulota bacterium]|nr:hypothetical protein [Candidatus Bipolaricaulota bacterium]